MNSDKIRNLVLEKIKTEEIKPRPRWHFWLRNTLFWAIFLFAALLGARALGVVLWMMLESNIWFLALSHGFHWSIIFGAVPLFWIICFLLFLVLAASGLHHTKKGYRLSLLKLMVLNFAMSLLLGTAMYLLGDPEVFERRIHLQVPIFHRFEESQKGLWSAPEEGRLAGIIIEITDEKMFLLDDFSHKRWTIFFENSRSFEDIPFAVEQKVRLVGKKIDEASFAAEIIGPWRAPFHFYQPVLQPLKHIFKKEPKK